MQALLIKVTLVCIYGNHQRPTHHLRSHTDKATNVPYFHVIHQNSTVRYRKSPQEGQ